MARREAKKQPNYILLSVTVAAVALVAVLLMFGSREKAQERTADAERGIAYLTALEQKDPSAVRQVRQEIYRQEMAQQKEELTWKIMAGEIDPFPLFQDYALLGDSRAIGYSYSEFLAEDRVLADGGNTIRIIPERIPALQQLNPSYVFLCYGLNDVSIGYWDDPYVYAAEYVSCVNLIQEALPDATIVVSSILPAKDPAFATSSRWYWIPDWNVVLEEVCRENGILFANCDWVYEQQNYYWVSDGIHLRPYVYPYWGGQLIITALYGGMEYEV